MKTTKWFAWVLLSTSISFAACAPSGDEESLDADDDSELMDASEAAPAQDNAPAPTNPTGSCKATGSGGTTVSGGTYSTDDDGYLWCCNASTCVECGGANTCTAGKKGIVLPPPGPPPVLMK